MEIEKPLPTEYRNLLSVAYKNVVGSHRSAWRIISSEMSKNGDTENIKEYMATVKKDLQTVCNEVLVSLCICIVCMLSSSFILLIVQ